VTKGCTKSISNRFVNFTLHQIWLGWSYFDMSSRSAARQRLNKQAFLGNGYASNNRGTVGVRVFYDVRAWGYNWATVFRLSEVCVCDWHVCVCACVIGICVCTQCRGV
jgi:hypothetical protein